MAPRSCRATSPTPAQGGHVCTRVQALSPPAGGSSTCAAPALPRGCRDDGGASAAAPSGRGRSADGRGTYDGSVVIARLVTDGPGICLARARWRAPCSAAPGAGGSRRCRAVATASGQGSGTGRDRPTYSATRAAAITTKDTGPEDPTRVVAVAARGATATATGATPAHDQAEASTVEGAASAVTVRLAPPLAV